MVYYGFSGNSIPNDYIGLIKAFFIQNESVRHEEKLLICELKNKSEFINFISMLNNVKTVDMIFKKACIIRYPLIINPWLNWMDELYYDLQKKRTVEFHRFEKYSLYLTQSVWISEFTSKTIYTMHHTG